LEVIKDNLDLFKKKTLEISETEGMKLKSLMHQKSRRYQLAIQNL
jgi:hypothetical protein